MKFLLHLNSFFWLVYPIKHFNTNLSYKNEIIHKKYADNLKRSLKLLILDSHGSTNMNQHKYNESKNKMKIMYIHKLCIIP